APVPSTARRWRARRSRCSSRRPAARTRSTPSAPPCSPRRRRARPATAATATAATASTAARAAARRRATRTVRPRHIPDIDEWEPPAAGVRPPAAGASAYGIRTDETTYCWWFPALGPSLYVLTNVDQSVVPPTALPK